MKLISCHIENFGALHSCDFSFSEGLNTFCSPNAGGKTTLADFIKAAFYGLPADTARSRFNARRRYRPFSGGAFGGNVQFEWKGANYRIERFFEGSSGDCVTVYRNGAVTREFAGREPGVAVFGLDAQSFERTLFISGGEGELSPTGGIVARLGDYNSPEDGENAAESAAAVLERAAKNLQGRGGKGLIPALEQSEKQLSAEIANINAVSARLGEKYAERAAICSRLPRVPSADGRPQSQRDRLAAELDYKRERAARILASYPAGLPSAGEIAALCGGAPQKDGGAKNNMRLPAALSFALSSLLIAAGIAFMFFSVFVGVAALCAGVLFAAATLGILVLGKRHPAARTDAEGVLKKYNLTGASAAVAAAGMERDAAEYAALKREIEEGEAALSREGDDRSAQSGEDAETLRRRLAAVDRDISCDESVIEGLDERLAALEDVRAELAERRRQYSAYTAAAMFIRRAGEELGDAYAAPVANAFSRYCAMLHSSPGGSVGMGKNYEVTLEGGGRLREEGHLSSGQRAAVGLCFRMALAESLFPSDRPFVVLDDPFADLDEEHMARAAAFLSSLAAEWQIIYFCCHPSRKI